jgi:outer membrane receptor protein involved in Fe transport
MVTASLLMRLKSWVAKTKFAAGRPAKRAARLKAVKQRCEQELESKLAPTMKRTPQRRLAAKRSRVLRAPLLCLALAVHPVVHANPGSGLTALSLEQLLELRIVGASKYEQRQSEVAAAVSVITRQEIKAFGWRTLDEALASLPGVYTTYDRQYSFIGTRGFGLPGDLNTRQLVTINGNRVNDPIFDAGPFGRQFPLDVDLIERIEFIPGPGGAVYGQNAMLGVVNVITRSGAEVSGTELTASYQTPQALRKGRASWGKKLETGTDLLVSVSGMRARGEDRFMDFGASGTRPGVAAGLDGERDGEFVGRIAHGPWSFEHVYGNRRKDDPTGAYLSDPLVAGSYQRDRFALTQLQFQDSFAGGALDLTGRLFKGIQRYRSNLTFTDIAGTATLQSPADSEWHGIELRAVSAALAGHKVMTGLEVQDNTRQDQASTGHLNPADDVFIARRGSRVGVFAQDEWNLADDLTATLGLRHDHNNATGGRFSPRIAVIWQADAQTTVKGLYGRAHRAPNVFERDYGDRNTQVANPALQGERIETLELTLDRRLGQKLSVRASAYEWRMHDLIVLGVDPISGRGQYQSGGDVKARGVELSADKTWGSGSRARASLALQDAAYGNGAKVINSPKLLAKLNASAPLSVAGLRAGYELRYDSSRVTPNGTALGGYAVSNLNLSTDALAPSLELSLGLYNLFDKKYAQPGSPNNWQNQFEQDGRTVRALFNLKF